MAVLEALKQGMPIDTALVKQTKSISKHRPLRLALIGLMALLTVGAGWYLFATSPTWSDWAADWKMRVSGHFTRTSSADVKERTFVRSSAKTAVTPVGESSSFVLADRERFVAPKATVRVIVPEADAVILPVNAEPKERGSGFGVPGSEEQTRQREERNSGKKVQSDMSQVGKPYSSESENGGGSGAKIEVYDESGQLIKRERVRTGGRL